MPSVAIEESILQAVAHAILLQHELIVNSCQACWGLRRSAHSLHLLQAQQGKQIASENLIAEHKVQGLMEGMKVLMKFLFCCCLLERNLDILQPAA